MEETIVYQYDDIDVIEYINYMSLELELNQVTYKCFHRKECSDSFWEQLIQHYGKPKNEDIFLLKIKRDE